MRELDGFEDRFAAAYRRYLDDARTDVDPVALAHAVAAAAPARSVGLGARPRMAWILLLLGLLTALALQALAFMGAPRLPAPFGLARPGLVALDDGGHIVVAQADGSGRRNITTGAATDSSPSWSPDGTKLAFWRTSDSQHFEIVIADQRGTVLHVIGLPAGTPHASFAWYPVSWSPDSRHLAFSLDIAGLSSIWTVGADGTGLRRLGRPGAQASDPVWSPDGGRIAYHGGNGYAGPTNGVYVMNADGGDAHQISHVEGTGYSFDAPQWQPGGDLIAFPVATDRGNGIFVVHSDGSAESEISNDPANACWLRWSPDGRRIAFDRAVSEASKSDSEPAPLSSAAAQLVGQIVIVDPDGSNATLPPGPPVGWGPPTWSPDGRSIAQFVYQPYMAEHYVGGVAVLGPVPGATTAAVVIDLTGHAPPAIVPVGPPILPDVSSSFGYPDGFSSWQRLAP